MLEHLEKPIAQYTYEALLDEYDTYIKGVARKPIPPQLSMTVEDLEQEGRIALWRAYTRYQTLPCDQFFKIFKTILANRIAYCFRACSTPASRQKCESEINEEVAGSDPDLHINYEREIVNIRSQLSPAAQKSIDELLSTEGGPRNYFRYRKAFKEVKDVVYGQS